MCTWGLTQHMSTDHCLLVLHNDSHTHSNENDTTKAKGAQGSSNEAPTLERTCLSRRSFLLAEYRIHSLAQAIYQRRSSTRTGGRTGGRTRTKSHSQYQIDQFIHVEVAVTSTDNGVRSRYRGTNVYGFMPSGSTTCWLKW